MTIIGGLFLGSIVAGVVLGLDVQYDMVKFM